MSCFWRSIDVRLAHADRRLRDGAGVTDTCFAVGFGSLSHFVTTFRRRYAIRPSDIRRKGRGLVRVDQGRNKL